MYMPVTVTVQIKINQAIVFRHRRFQLDRTPEKYVNVLAITIETCFIILKCLKDVI